MTELRLLTGETLYDHVENQERSVFTVDLVSEDEGSMISVVSLGQLLWDDYLLDGGEGDIDEPGVYKNDISSDDDVDFYTVVLDFKTVLYPAVVSALDDLNEEFGTDFELAEG